MEDQKKSRKKHKKRSVMPILCGSIICIIGITLTIIFLWYWSVAKRYEDVFFPNTVINGIDASEKSIEEVENLILAGTAGYQLEVIGRDQSKELITAEEISMISVFDGSLEQILAKQVPMKWKTEKNNIKSYEIDTMISYDQELLKQKIESMGFYDEQIVKKPENAYLSEYISGQGYHIIEESYGNEVIPEKVDEAIFKAVQNLQSVVNLEELNCYTEPTITSENAQLQLLKDTLNRYVQSEVTYKFGDKQEKLTGDIINQWVTVNEESDVILDRDAVSAYVKTLASKYNTAYGSKYFQTSYGPVVKITEGNYGWRINQGEEVKALLTIIESGETVTREPVYIQTAASHSGPDYGDTYVEINLTAQHLFFYKDGKLLVESDFVSGNSAKGYDTPPGAFPLTYKERNATLRGENYATPVSYWMPFNGNVGMHDASWRNSFGKEIYKTGGSHGCINLPPAVAKLIYENITQGMPVLCYQLEGTENKDEVKPPEEKPQESVTETLPSESIDEPQVTEAPEEPFGPEATEAESSDESTAETEASDVSGENSFQGPGGAVQPGEAPGPGTT